MKRSLAQRPRLSRRDMSLHIMNIITIALIVEFFLISMMAVRKYAREDCFDRIEETAVQAAAMFNSAMEEHQNKLTVFADILAANSSNPDERLMLYMESFCQTQDFSAVCIHRADGSVVSYGAHPHDSILVPPWQEECQRLPYVSEVYSEGARPWEKMFYQAVPIVRDGQTAGILYGYIRLSKLPQHLYSTIYGGKCRFYIVDGDTGDFLLNSDASQLGNLYTDYRDRWEVRPGYDFDSMQESVRGGGSGYFIFRTQADQPWMHAYYMPLGVHNWSLQMTVDEPTAFAGYALMNRVVMMLAVGVIVLMLIHVLVLMTQNKRTKRQDRARLEKSQYINRVQSALLNAHYDDSQLERALRVVGDRQKAETVLLLTFAERQVERVYHWPSRDEPQAQSLLGRNIRADFPEIYDVLIEGQSVKFDNADPDSVTVSDNAQVFFDTWDARNMIITPVLDSSGSLRGAIAVVNTDPALRTEELLECITYDLLMAITNVENNAIIRRMGTMDLLTNTKNRNSYEQDLEVLAALPANNLWCVFIDVNGLHEVNNTRGHKAGDLMLCAVADAVKRAFGTKYTYRVGGDEFVAFDTDSDHASFMRRKYAITEELRAKGYFVSVGFEGIGRKPDGIFDVQKVINDAEVIMYQDKWEYYQKNQIPSERGHFPSAGTEPEGL